MARLGQSRMQLVIFCLIVQVYFANTEASGGKIQGCNFNTTLRIELNDTLTEGSALFDFENVVLKAKPSDSCWNNFDIIGTKLVITNSSLFFTCTQPNGGLYTAVLIIKSSPLKPPFFTENAYYLNVSEEATEKTKVFNLKENQIFQDCYHTENGVDIDYKCTGDGAEIFCGGFCSYNHLCVNQKLDYERKTEYEINIVAKDTNVNNPFRWNTTVYINIVDVDDSDPVFSNRTYVIKIPENNTELTGIYLHTNPEIYAYDKDRGEGKQKILYNISKDPLNLFSINEFNGSLMLNGVLDYETIQDFNILIKAFQINDALRSAYATVHVEVMDINDNPPVFGQRNYHIMVQENSPVNYTIATVLADDQDSAENSKNHYKLLNLDDQFSINDQGVIQVKNQNALDREENEQIVLMIKAYDNHSFDEANITIEILDENDNSPVFNETLYKFFTNGTHFVDENPKVYATDRDAGQNKKIQYSIYNDVANLYPIEVNQSTGILSFKPNHHLFEEKQVLIQACDDPILASSRRCAMVPVFLDFPNNETHDVVQRVNVSVLEEAPVGTIVHQMESFGAKSYALSSSHEFKISDRGVITTKERLNREERSSYRVFVLVKGSNMNSNITVDVTVEDINDNPPEFPQAEYFFSKEDLSSVSGVRVLANDSDEGLNAEISYKISDSSAYYSVNNVSGKLYLKDVNRNHWPVDEVIIVSSADHGSPSLHGFCTVHITLIEIIDEHTLNFPTLLTVEEIKQKQPSVDVSLSKILDVDIATNAISFTGKDTDFQAYLQMKATKNGTDVKAIDLRRDVILRLSEIQALLGFSAQNQSSSLYDNSKAAIIALIAIASLMFVAMGLSIIVISIKWKRYKEDLSRNRLYENLTRRSSLYESQEIKTTINTEDEISECNGSVNTGITDSGDATKPPPDTYAFPNNGKVEQETVLKETHPPEAFNEALSSLEDLSEHLQREERSIETNDFNTDRNALEKSNDDDAQIDVTLDDDYVDVDDRSELVLSKQEERNSHAYENHSYFKLGENSSDSNLSPQTEGDTDSQEPVPDYEVKQVRFSTQVLDTGANKIEELKSDKDAGVAEETNEEEESEKSGNESKHTDKEDDSENDENDKDVMTNSPEMGFRRNESSFMFNDEFLQDVHIDPTESDKVDEEINSPLDFLRNENRVFDDGDEGSFSFQMEETTAL